MDRLAESYLKTLLYLDEGKLAKATLEYRKGYLYNVKKLYSEAAKVYPLRFSKAERWCVWTKKLYVLSRQTEETLKKQDSEKSLEFLEKLRRHFYELHIETKTLHCNDLIYEFRTEAMKSKPSKERLERIVKQLEEAEPSHIARIKAKEYAKAKTTWKKTVSPLLDDGQIDPSEQDSLREATEDFYRAFGIQYE